MKLRLALASAAVALAAASTAGAVDSTASATATIVAPGSVTKTQDLDFGTIARPTGGQTTRVTVASSDTNAGPTTSGGNGFIPTPGQGKAAKFRIVGGAGSSYSVATPTLTFSNNNGNLANVAAEAVAAATGPVGTLPGTAGSGSSGTDDLIVGGHFDITSSTALQTYTGTLSITVTFN